MHIRTLTPVCTPAYLRGSMVNRTLSVPALGVLQFSHTSRDMLKNSVSRNGERRDRNMPRGIDGKEVEKRINGKCVKAKKLLIHK